MKNLFLFIVVLILASATSVAQPNTVYSHGDPTPEEQLMLEMVNRARANPTEEGIRLMDTDDSRVQFAYDYFKINKSATKQAFTTYPQRPPLAFHPDLITIARAHSKDMDDNNFQGHNSTNGDDLSDRYSKIGYASQGVYGENVAAYSESVWHGHCGLNVDWGEENQVVLGHRENIMNFKNYEFTEIGIGILFNGKGLMQGHVGPYVITQDFGTRSVRYITGVVYTDKNNNGFYDIGEGVEGVQVRPATGTYYAVTGVSGGYAIPYSGSSSMVVTASGGGLADPIVKTVSLDGKNVKVDFVPAAATPGATALLTPANNATAQPLTLTLTWRAASNADTYEWQVATAQNFSAASIVDNGSGASLSADVNVSACNTRHYWRVRGVNTLGPGQWSTPFMFTTSGKMPASTSATQPRGPVTAANNGNINFTWSAAADAARYHVRVKSGQAPFSVVYQDSSFTGTSASIPTMEIGEGSFTWEVRSANPCGNSGWSTPASFSLTVTNVAESLEHGWLATVHPYPVQPNSVLTVQAPHDATVAVTIADLTGAEYNIGTFNVVAGTNILDHGLQVPRGFSVMMLRVNGTLVSRLTVVKP